MTCINHPDRPAVRFCRTCGRPLCSECQRPAEGTVYCAEHLPFVSQGSFSGAETPSGGVGPNPYSQGQPFPHGAAQFTAPVQTSPVLAFILGWIPGVGAIYNGQYLKGLIHAGVFGLIVSLLTTNDGRSGAPFLAILLAAFVFYMPFEAFHTAKQRQLGIPVEEWSSLGRGSFPMTRGSRTSIGPVILIGIGVLFLLDTMNLIEFRDIGRFWPLLLIAAGAFRLYSRISGGPYPSASPYVNSSNAPPPDMGPIRPAAPSTQAGADLVETGHE